MLVGLLHPITAAGGSTVMTGIGWVFIAVITTFPRPHHAITTAVDTAVGLAGVFIDPVAVIAGFVAGFPLRQSLAADAITTTGLLAVGSAAVVVLPVAVIAGLIALDDAVTTAGHFAVVGAFIVVNLITIIAIFQALPQQTVTTGREETARHTSVVIVCVAVVAGLKARFTLAEISA